MLVLSLFPGIGLLDMAFEQEGFCVVRGPDVLWGGDIRRFHPPAGKFDGVIGGPPCQRFSGLANIVRARYGSQALAPNLIPEFERCVQEAAPDWFVMENVPRAPVPSVAGYSVDSLIVDNRDFNQPQRRERRISFGVKDWSGKDVSRIHGTLNIKPVGRMLFHEPAVTATAGGRRAVPVRDENGRVRGKQGDADWCRLGRRSLADMCELQGIPKRFFDHSPLTEGAKRRLVANGVPLPMGRAIARAVRAAIGMEVRP